MNGGGDSGLDADEWAGLPTADADDDKTLGAGLADLGDRSSLGTGTS